MLELSGLIGSILFAICAIPQAIECIKSGHSRGLNWFFLIAWAFGEIFTVIYVWPKQDWILLGNYFFNSGCVAVMLYYKIWERK
jgi:uncharacterized protein with PQ loop repeat